MRTPITIALLFLVSAAAGAAACRHLGMTNEPDSGPGPHCDPCAEYQIRVNACIKPACENMECPVCEYSVSRLRDPSCGEASDGGQASGFDGTLEINPDMDADAGTCLGDEREEAYRKLQWFTCEDDEYVSGVLEEIDRECVPAPKTCYSVGEACNGGYCYYIGEGEEPQCQTPGAKVVGEGCSASNSCVAGAQCLDAGGTFCYQVCQSYADCYQTADCVDTGLGFNVCVYYEE
ncbi:MAG: hypothetical protein HY897_15920 [Deltaproteobacteria bacterium]|nr:hypothetical protein [Deltaproteobacteria bacterium]